MQDSGNCYKPRLLMHRLGIPFRLVDTDSRDGSTRTPEFLALNPTGKVPLLVLPDGRRLSESNAMLLHLAEGTRYLPADRYERALTYQWLFFEQYSHEPYIAVARFVRLFLKKPDDPRLPELERRGHHALGVMERHLARNDFFVAGKLTIADIALFAYTHCAEDAGFDLGSYPAVRAWIDRCLAQPGMTAMPSPQ